MITLILVILILYLICYLRDCQGHNHTDSKHIDDSFTNELEHEVFNKFSCCGGKVYHNLYVPMGDSETTEIDVLLVTSKCLIVFECKDYNGFIFGSASAKHWTQCHPNGVKYKFYNPILQNDTHIRNLHKYLGTDMPIYSVIVFGRKSTLKTSMPETVCLVDEVETIVKKLIESTNYYTSNNYCDSICDMLNCICNVSDSVKSAHVDAVRKYTI